VCKNPLWMKPGDGVEIDKVGVRENSIAEG
jgi:hypothetical protein